MSNIKKIIGVSTLFLLVLGVGLFVFSKNKVSAQELPQNTNQPAGATQNQSFNYVAQPGDSYSLMARKAIQTYGIINKVNLSEAQIIFAETNITKLAGSPMLNIGQKVEIKQDLVKQWVDKAKELTKDQQAEWNVYAQHANFNTNHVGQP